MMDGVATDESKRRSNYLKFTEGLQPIQDLLHGSGARLRNGTTSPKFADNTKRAEDEAQNKTSNRSNNKEILRWRHRQSKLGEDLERPGRKKRSRNLRSRIFHLLFHYADANFDLTTGKLRRLASLHLHPPRQLRSILGSSRISRRQQHRFLPDSHVDVYIYFPRGKLSLAPTIYALSFLFSDLFVFIKFPQLQRLGGLNIH